MQLPACRAATPVRVAVSLGCAQAGVQVRGLPARTRTTGGGSVLLGPWLLRAVLVLPRSHAALADGPRGAALWFSDAHRRWLHEAGIAAQPWSGPTMDHWSCFAGRGPGELFVGDRKLTGIAQRWQARRAVLWSATLLTPVPWELLCVALGHAPQEAAELEAAATSVAHVNAQARPSAHALATWLAAAAAQVQPLATR